MATTWQSDPNYIAALRAANLDESNTTSDVRTRQQRSRRNLADLLPEIARQGTFAREGISNNFLSSGMFRSGVRQDAHARQRYDEARQSSQAQTAATDDVADLESSLARVRADANRRRTDAGMLAQQGVYTRQQEEALRAESVNRDDALAAQQRALEEKFYREIYGTQNWLYGEGMNPERRHGVNV